MKIFNKSLNGNIDLDNCRYKNVVMEDGKVFSPSIHRRFLPSQYVSMVRGGYLLPVSPVKFTWVIRRWLGLEVSNLIRMKNTPSLSMECKVRASLLGKNIFNYLMDSDRVKKNLIYGRGVGGRDGYEWVYLVSEDWIYDNMVDLYNSYLAMGCYYTVTSLQAFGKISGKLEAELGGNTVSISLEKGEMDGSIFSLIDNLRENKLFRESLSYSCIEKLNLSDTSSYLVGRHLKNEDGAIEKFKEFYKKETNTKKVTVDLLSSYGVPFVGDCSPEAEVLSRLYIG